MPVELIATRPSFTMLCCYAHSNTCVNASFKARLWRRRKALSAQLPTRSPAAKLRNARSSTRCCSTCCALVMPQCVGIEPNAQHQLRSIKLAALGAGAMFKLAHIPLLNYPMDEKAKVLLAQLVPYARRMQIRLIRAVNLESRHASLVAQLRCELQVPCGVLTQTP